MIGVTTVRELCAWPIRALASGMQPFITMATAWLDGEAYDFGRVIEGLEVVRAKHEDE